MCPCVVSFLPLLPLPPLMLSTDVALATKWNVLQLIDCSPLRSIPITGTSSLLWALLTSHSSLLLRLMGPPVRPPRLRCALFPLIYLPHLLVLPATFGLHRHLPTYPYFPALYVVPVRQVKGLPAASFRFHLTMDTLAVQLCTSSLPTRTRDFHPLERAHGAQTNSAGTSYEIPALSTKAFFIPPANHFRFFLLRRSTSTAIRITAALPPRIPTSGRIGVSSPVLEATPAVVLFSISCASASAL